MLNKKDILYWFWSTNMMTNIKFKFYQIYLNPSDTIFFSYKGTVGESVEGGGVEIVLKFKDGSRI